MACTDVVYANESDHKLKNFGLPSSPPSDNTHHDNNEVIMKLQHYPKGPQCKKYSIIILLLVITSHLFFGYAIVQYQFIEHHIEAIPYTLAETCANAFMCIFSVFIYIQYIYTYKSMRHGRRIGRVEGRDCTNFDVYATFSLLWFWMCVLSYLEDGDILYGIFNFLRMIAIIVPGYIHQTYIRFKIIDEYKAQHFIYLGDINIYKICCIIFLILQLCSNVVQLPLNAPYFQESITNIFHLDDESDIFHFQFIIAAVFGRPFVSILNFHLLILYLTWFVNGDKPHTHHNLDLFALTMHDQGLNVLVGIIVMVFYNIDVIFIRHIWYETIICCTYVSCAVYHFYFLIQECTTHQRSSIINKNIEQHARVDVFTILESSFVLVGGVSACVLYIMNIDDYKKKFDAFSELAAWSLFIISQYIFVIFIQLDVIYGRKLLMRRSTQQMLSWSALISAVSITFLFSFEYAHFVEFLTHHYSSLSEETEHGTSNVTLIASYSLFWCLIEYFIWSFVTINHMLHHVRYVEHMAHTEEIERQRLSIILNEVQEENERQRVKSVAVDVESPSSLRIRIISPKVVANNVMKSKAYRNTLNDPDKYGYRPRANSYLFVQAAPQYQSGDSLQHDIQYDENDNIY